MSDLATLARPYAKAAFEFAKSSQAVSVWTDMLQVLVSVVLDPKVASLLSEPQRSLDERAALLSSLCEGVMSASGRNFVRLLARSKRLSLLPQIRDRFEYLKSLSEKTVHVNVSSAIALTKDYELALTKVLSNKLKQALDIVFEVDPQLIGGAVIRYGDVVIDASVKNKLDRLKIELQQ